MNREEHLVWRDFVYASRNLTPAHKLVLLMLSKFSDWPAGTNARPGVARLADGCALSRRAVEAALAEGRRLDLIEQTARANPKRALAATYRLLPAPVSTRTSVRVEHEPETDSTRTAMRIETDFQPAQNGYQPANHVISTRTLVQPTKPLTPNQNTKGGAVSAACATTSDQTGAVDQTRARPLVAALAPFGEPQSSNVVPDPPPRYCSRHMPDGTETRCGPCRDARYNFTQWEKRWGPAWDALHPPPIGKASAKALAILQTSQNLIASMRADETATQEAADDVVDAEIVDAAPPPNLLPCHHCAAPAAENGLCTYHLASARLDQGDQP